jgi:outer membrane lipoprotein LolB
MWIGRVLRTCLLATVMLGVAGCATLSVPPEAQRVHSGRFAATVAQDGKSENTTGRFTLSIDDGRLLLDLATPLGTTLARVESGPQGATLRVPGNGGMREASGPNPEALAEELLGWPLPAGGIADWIEGRPAPGRPAGVQGDRAAPTTITQDGWTIDIAERFAAGTPRRLTLSRPARAGSPIALPSPAIILRLVLDEHAPDASQ